MFNLITIGDTVIDTHIQVDEASLECQIKDKPWQICLDFASKIPITNSFQSLGGNAANVAAAVSKLGLKTAIISSLGDDANGRMALAELEKFNIDTQLVYTEKNKPTRYSIVINFKSERTILSFHGKRKYVLPKNMPHTECIYFTGLSQGFEKLQTNTLKWLKKHPAVKLAFNPGSYQLKKAMDLVIELITQTDILILNLEEAEKILNTNLKKEKKVSSLIHQLLNLGPSEVVITDAANGAYVGNLNEIWQMQTFPVKVVAKTGAGDAFSAGYISARSLGYNQPQALRWGVANSCAVITKVGAQNGLLTKKALQKLLTKYDNIKPKLIQ